MDKSWYESFMPQNEISMPENEIFMHENEISMNLACGQRSVRSNNFRNVGHIFLMEASFGNIMEWGMISRNTITTPIYVLRISAIRQKVLKSVLVF